MRSPWSRAQLLAPLLRRSSGLNQEYRKFETVQYDRILNPKLSEETREILRHFDKVSKISKICFYTLQDNLKQYNHP